MARASNFIRLNVGGRMMATNRSTLRQIEDSRLAAMFTEVNEAELDRDENNNIFLDYNPKYFNIILNYLRAKSIQRTNTPFPKLKPEEIKPFSELATQLGLEKEFALNLPKFTLHGTWIQLNNYNAVAAHTGHNRAVGYALSDIHPNGIIRWILKLESLQSQMFIGVLKADTEPYDNRSYDMQGSYGWLLNVGDEIIGSAWNDGKKIYNLIANVRKGDTVEVLLNSVKAKLSIVLSPVKEFHMFLPNSEGGWRLHINLFHHNDMIQILSP